MIEEIERQELDEVMFQMALHGADKKSIDKFKSEYENRSKPDTEKVKDIRIPLSQFERMGLKIGKYSSTRVIRGNK